MNKSNASKTSKVSPASKAAITRKVNVLLAEYERETSRGKRSAITKKINQLRKG